MRELYDIAEEMMISSRMPISAILILLCKLRVEDIPVTEGYRTIIHDENDIPSGVAFRDGKIVVGSIGLSLRNARGNLVDIGNGISICVAEREHLYKFLVRNGLLTSSSQFKMQRLILEHS